MFRLILIIGGMVLLFFGYQLMTPVWHEALSNLNDWTQVDFYVRARFSVGIGMFTIGFICEMFSLFA